MLPFQAVACLAPLMKQYAEQRDDDVMYAEFIQDKAMQSAAVDLIRKQLREFYKEKVTLQKKISERKSALLTLLAKKRPLEM